MKMTRKLIMASVLTGALVTTAFAQTTNNGVRLSPQNWITQNPVFAKNPAALELITNLLAEPEPELSVPDVSSSVSSAPGTYWNLTGPQVPLPCNPFPDLPVYAIGTNNNFIIDDRSVDYGALSLLAQAEAQLTGLTNGTPTSYTFDTNGLWIEVPTNSLATSEQFTIILHNTIQGQSYDVLTKANDLLLPSWATELVVTGVVGNVTPVQLAMNNRTNLFVRARTSVSFSFYLVTPPLSQNVIWGDTVTFSVETGGNTNLTFQWLLNGVAIAGATNRSYTIDCVQLSDGGDYSVVISDGTNPVVAPAAHLGVNSTSSDSLHTVLLSQRQDYKFKSGKTYFIFYRTPLYGNTVIEAGSVIKFSNDPAYEWMGYTNASLVIMGTLTCPTEPYYPAILTSLDDYWQGMPWPRMFDLPQTAQNGVAFIDMANAKSSSISNLRICFADWGVTTPLASRRLDVWDCQFVWCNYGVVNLVDGSGTTNGLHNVLFSACGAAIGAANNSIDVEAEQVTADVWDFCMASTTPHRMALTNSIIWGSFVTASTLSTVNVAFNPDGTNFQASAQGYYLAANSPLHRAGTANISPRLQTELRNKTTYPPVALPALMQLSGDMTLGPQAPRYTNGAPDLGYHYDALDYTVARIYLIDGCSVTVLPGTAIGFRMEYIPQLQNYNYHGFIAQQNSSFVSQGTPAKPNTFVDVQLVQEGPQWPIFASFVPNFWPGEPNAQPPSLDFRFSNFYLGIVSSQVTMNPYAHAPSYHICAGSTFYYGAVTVDSAVYLTLRDCQFHGGQIDLGKCDYGFSELGLNYPIASGAVSWINNLFDDVDINLDPDWVNYDDPTLYFDLSFQACNNLFRNCNWLRLEPVPALAGNWTLRDNLFDKVTFLQDTNQPLDYDYNGNWPLSPTWLGWYGGNATLNPTTAGNGAHDVVFSNAPPFQAGPLGNYYLPNTTPLYGAGSRTPADAALYQYTTQTDQTKEGDEPSGHMVNIGLHYVAANSYGQPFDSDGDGIPDYVENWHGDGAYSLHADTETDWQNPVTVEGVLDVTNSVYDDIDLSGDGLVGRIKKALGMNPLDSNNPLTLTQVAGSNQNMIIFEVPISYCVLTNIGHLNLSINGYPATLVGIHPATNNTLIYWNSTYDSPGRHLLQAQLTVKGTGNDADVITALGTVKPFYSANLLQFFESGQIFNANGACLQAQLSRSNASYTIQLYDPSITPPTLINTITGSTTDGIIQEAWGLTNTDGTPFVGEKFTAVYNVTIPDDGTVMNNFAKSDRAVVAYAGANDGGSTGAYSQTQIKPGSGVQGNGFDFAYVYTPPFPTFYDFMGIYSGNPGAFWMGMQSVVDTLLMPQTWGGGGPNNYVSGFNYYTGQGNNTLSYCGGLDRGYPGYINDSGALNRLFQDMTNGTTQVKNFFMFAHGGRYDLESASFLGPGGISPPDVYISTDDISGLLGNVYDENGWKSLNNPYRFVFLYACSSATWGDWRRAFGIMPIKGNEAPQGAAYGLEPQAFVGWGDDTEAGTAPVWTHNIFEVIYHVPGSNVDDDETKENAWCFTQTLNRFYYEWMQGNTPLAQCIHDAAYPGPGQYPFPLPGINQYTLSAVNSPLGSFSFTTKHTGNAPIIVAGHSGLTRTGLNGFYDNLYKGVQQ